MRSILLLLLLAGCSTVASRREDPPIFVADTAMSLADFEGCFAEKTAKEEVQHLPKRHGGTFSSGVTGALGRYVSWLVDITDVGATRRVSVYAPDSIWGRNRHILPSVQACL